MAAARKKKAETSSTPSDTKSNTPLTVKQLTTRIANRLIEAFPTTIKVVGEITNPRHRTHWYFDLKDHDAVVSCVMFASAARKLKCAIEHGQEVVVSGKVEFFPKQGKTQLYVSTVKPVGVGELDLTYRKRCDELRQRGYFDPEHKAPLPFFSPKIAIVTSASSAALQDVIDTVARRCPATQLCLVDARVQGANAASEIARAIQAIDAKHEQYGISAIILTRGGGSLEDLWCFNEQVVADAIYNASIPIVAAIGHETDTTIAELVADERCATPTQAAMRLTPERDILIDQLDMLAHRAHRATSRITQHQANVLTAHAKHLKHAVRYSLHHAQRQTEHAFAVLQKHHPVSQLTQRHKALAHAHAALLRAKQTQLVVAAANACTSMTAHRVDLIDEDQARGTGLALLKKVAHARSSNADEHLDEIRATNRKEGHPRFTGHCARQVRLARARRPDHQDAFGNPPTEALKPVRILEKFNDLLQLLLGLVGPSHIGKSRLVLVFHQELGPALAKGKQPACAALASAAT